MKRVSTAVWLLGSGIVLGAVGQWAIDRAGGRGAAEQVRRAEERVRAAEAKAAAGEQEKAALAKTLAAEREQATRAAAEVRADEERREEKRHANVAKKQAARAAELTTVPAGAAPAALAEDAAAMRRVSERAELKVTRHYAALFAQLGLPADKQEALIELLVDKRELATDVAAATFRSGGDPREDPAAYADLIAATRGDLEQQIRSLLGEADYAKYQAFDRSAGQAQVIGQLNQLLAGTRQPLSAQQASQLQATLQANNTGKITGKVVKDATTYLSPQQMQVLRDLRAIQQGNPPRRSAPTPPAPPGGK